MKRALESLRSIHLLWHPQTAAPFEERMFVIDSVRERYPETGWSLMLSILPTPHDVATPTSKPRWRPWAPQQREALTYVELGRQTREVVDRLLRAAEVRATRWTDLIGLLDSLPRDSFDQVVTTMSSIDFSESSREEILGLWSALRKLVAKHWKFAEAEWALPDAEVERLLRLYETLTPSDLKDRYSWLFSMHPDLPQIGVSLENRDEAALNARIPAIREIVEQGGMAAVLDVIGAADSPWHVGNALSRYDASLASDFLPLVLDSDDIRLFDAAQGFLTGIRILMGDDPLLGLLSPDFTIDWNPVQRAEIFLALPFDHEAWDLLASEGAAVRQHYWSTVSPFGRGQLSGEVVQRAAGELLAYGQNVAAVHLLSLYRAEGQQDLAVRALRQLAEEPPSDPRTWHQIGYELKTLLESLEESEMADTDELAQLEWTYLPILARVEFGYRPPMLDRALASSPGLFVEVLGTVYRRAGDEAESEPTEEQKARAELGFELLFRWATLPGLHATTLDEEELRAWVFEVRNLAREEGLPEIADTHIGQIFAYSPDGTDGLWPHEVVRQLIEDLASDAVESGFAIQVFNNRGGFTRALGEGGEQERGLAERFARLAEKTIGRWYRTGSVLRRIAMEYETGSRREDERAEVDRTRWE
jgi:hypothetical protein